MLVACWAADGNFLTGSVAGQWAPVVGGVRQGELACPAGPAAVRRGLSVSSQGRRHGTDRAARTPAGEPIPETVPSLGPGPGPGPAVCPTDGVTKDRLMTADRHGDADLHRPAGRTTWGVSLCEG